MSVLRAFRVGVVGAGRSRNGVGEHLARFLHAAGTRVVAVAGSSADSAARAAQALAERHGIDARPYDHVPRMIEDARLDALVIASPDATHGPCLRQALAAGVHALCEKPLLALEGGFVAEGERLVAAFAERGLCLAVNAQWRFALATYLLLFPDVEPRAARSFAMAMAPPATGREMIASAMPHPLSLLDHLFPDAPSGLRDVRVEQPSPERARVTFTHPGRGGIACDVRLATSMAPPRPASLAFDGHAAARVIREPGYRFALRTEEGGGREVPLPDPMETLVKRFVATVRKGPPFPPDPAIVPGLRHLHDLLDRWP